MAALSGFPGSKGGARLESVDVAPDSSEDDEELEFE